MPLTSHERVRRAFAGEEQDRIPRYDTFWGDTIRRWSQEGLSGGADQVLRELDADLYRIHGIYWPWPYPGRNEKVAEDEETVTFVDQWGATLRHFKNKDTTPEHVGWECDSPTAWREKIRPLIADQPIEIDVEGAKQRFEAGKKQEQWLFIDGIEPIEILRKLLGDEVSLIAMMEEPEWIRDICEVTTDNSIRNYNALWEAGVRPDTLWVYGDMAYNHATMCSPQVYRDLVWPSHKRLCDWAHEHDMRFIYHTDGDVRGVLDLYVEAGFDALQPLEVKANMDIRKLIPNYGKDLLFFGNVDVMSMITNDLERIEAEVKAKLYAGKANGRYIYHSDHSIPPQVSWQTYQKLIGLLDKHGSY